MGFRCIQGSSNAVARFARYNARMDFDEQKWERIRDVLIAEGSGKAPRISSTRTLFGIPSAVDQAMEAIVAEDEAKHRAQRVKAAKLDAPATGASAAACDTQSSSQEPQA